MALPAQRDTDTTDTPHVMAQPLMALVNETSPAFGLAFGDFRPEGETRLALDLRGGEFDALLRWLALLEQRHGIRVSGMEVRPTDTPGQVDAGVVVERRAPGEGGWP